LLRHRRHQPPRQRPALSELHAVAQRHGGIVPRGFIVRAVIGLRRRGRRCNVAIEQSGQELCGLCGRYRGDAIRQAEYAGEKSV